MMKLIVVFALVSIALVIGETCDATLGYETFNPTCTTKDQPYCRRTVLTLPAAYECVECLSICDCGMDEYCSSKPGEIGTCVKFSASGDSCRPLSGSQIRNTDFDTDWKCADTYFDSLLNATQINFQGFCSGGSCVMCNPYSFSQTKCSGNGMGETRNCSITGNYITYHSRNWNAKWYYVDPTWVWAPIFWIFFFLTTIGVGAAQAFFMRRKNMASSQSRT